MKTAVFYLSLKPAKDRVPVKVGTVTVYVRGESLGAGDVGRALDDAIPRPDETVMNSHEITA